MDATPQPWSSTDIDRVFLLIQEGRSFGQIAAQLGRTRPAIVGLVARVRAKKANPQKQEPVKLPPRIIAAPVKIFGEDEGLTIIDLAPHQCRFSIGAREDGVWVFCGERTRKLGDALCNHHHKLSYIPIQRRR
jgi:hypothetical protein